MILVTGATGTVGREVVKQLLALGLGVRAVTRNPEKANFPAGVEVAAGDLGNPQTIPALLDGVEKVYMILAPGAKEHLPKLARQAGVRHIVMLSSAAIDAPVDNAIGRSHLAGEQAVREAGVAWTFLRPGAVRRYRARPDRFAGHCLRSRAGARLAGT